MPDDQHLANDDLENIAEDAEDVDDKELQHVCLLNLAACDLKLRRYAQCIQHCDMALAQRPGDAKAHYRRATARIALGEELPRAREDLEAARSLMISELRRRGRRMSGVPGLTHGFPGGVTQSLPISFNSGEANTNGVSEPPINTAGLLGIPFGSTGRTDSGVSCLGIPEFYTGDVDATNQVYDTDVIGDDDDDITQPPHSSTSPIAAVNILSSMSLPVGNNTTVSARSCQTFSSAEPVSDNPDPHDSKSIELQQAFQQLRRAEQAEENRARLLFSPDNVA
jgi:tetratricopeptide (TPR) repeat protein